MQCIRKQVKVARYGSCSTHLQKLHLVHLSNDHLLIGPTVHPSIINVLLHFRCHRVALTTDVSWMYRAHNHQCDMHQFVWREDPQQPLKDYQMTRLTFGVSASPFIVNIAMRQNALDHQKKYPLAAHTILDSFYVDNSLDGKDSVDEAIKLQAEMQERFEFGGFVLRKWKSSEPAVFTQIPHNW